jgi:hypothetical protein
MRAVAFFPPSGPDACVPEDLVLGSFVWQRSHAPGLASIRRVFIIIEAGNGNPAARIVQRRDEVAENLSGVVNGPAEVPGMEVGAGPADQDLSGDCTTQAVGHDRPTRP